jgi:hypothetical protein
MSTVKANNHQIGQSATATNNATWYQPASPDGTVRLGVGNAGATTTDVITATSTSVTVPSLSSSNTFGFKNRIINGGMVIDQRNAGASSTPVSGAYLTDRWVYLASQASKFTAQQNAGSVTPPAGFINYLGLTSSSAYSITASDVFYVSQYIEGLNIADLGWGSASAATITLSFWVRSSLTGTFGGALNNSAYNRSYPFTYTISAANTWTPITVTITGDTSGTWLTTNGAGIRLNFGLGCGSTYSGTAGSWSGSDYRSATGATSVVGTNGATFYITGVQLEVGSAATSFDFRSYGQELALCQRYYQSSWDIGTAAGSASHIGGIHVLSWGDGNASGISWQVPMRADPTVTFYPTNSTSAGNVNSGGTDRAATATYPSMRGYSYITVTSGSANTFTRFQYIASAEL